MHSGHCHTYLHWILFVILLPSHSVLWETHFSVLYSLLSRYLLSGVAFYHQQTLSVLFYCFSRYFLDMLSNVDPSKGPCGTLLVTFLPFYSFTFAPMPYLLTSYLSVPEPSLSCNGCLVSFTAFGESLCQKLSRYPSELCQLGHIYLHSTTTLQRTRKRFVKQNVTLQKSCWLSQIDFIYPGVH